MQIVLLPLVLMLLNDVCTVADTFMISYMGALV